MSMPSNSEIASLVRQHLTNRSLGDIRFEVEDNHIQAGENWWRVPVRPTRLPVRLSSLYEFLADVEEELNAKGPYNILLMSGEPLEEETHSAAAALPA